jgi:hypothetical protein
MNNLKSVHFHLEAGGQFIFGMEAATASPTVEVSPSAAASSSAATSAGAQVSSSAGSSQSAAASASSTPAPTATPTPAPTPTPVASPSASTSVGPTPTPIYTAFPISLNGTVADGDVDFTNKTAHVIGGLPGVPGLSGEVIIVDQYAYVRAYGATRYTLESASSVSINPSLSSGPAVVVTQMLAVANAAALSPVLVGTEQEPSGPCYHIRVDVTKSVLNDKLSSLAVVQALGGGKLDLWITQGDYQLERLEMSTSDPNAGAAAVRLVLSNWNDVAAITDPPITQVGDEPTASGT